MNKKNRKECVEKKEKKRTKVINFILKVVCEGACGDGNQQWMWLWFTEVINR